MISFKKEMEKIEVKSPVDCVWFLSEISRCLLPGVNKRNSECHCLEGEMDDLCIWITKFLKSSPKFDLEELEGIKMPDDLNLLPTGEINADIEKALMELLKSVPQE